MPQLRRYLTRLTDKVRRSAHAEQSHPHFVRAYGRRVSRYHKIPRDLALMQSVWAEVFLDGFRAAPNRIVLELDATDDPLPGYHEGQLSFFTATTRVQRATASGKV